MGSHTDSWHATFVRTNQQQNFVQGDHVLGLSFKDGFAEECVLNSQVGDLLF